LQELDLRQNGIGDDGLRCLSDELKVCACGCVIQYPRCSRSGRERERNREGVREREREEGGRGKGGRKRQKREREKRERVEG
jgi:hypothetical protein